MKDRGLKGVELIVSDKCLGLVENLAEFYPDAKVLLSVREPGAWERSMRETVWAVRHGESLIRLLSSARGQVDPRWRRYLALVDRMFWSDEGTFANGHERPERPRLDASFPRSLL